MVQGSTLCGTWCKSCLAVTRSGTSAPRMTPLPPCSPPSMRSSRSTPSSQGIESLHLFFSSFFLFFFLLFFFFFSSFFLFFLLHFFFFLWILIRIRIQKYGPIGIRIQGYVINFEEEKKTKNKFRTKQLSFKQFFKLQYKKIMVPEELFSQLSLEGEFMS